MNQLLLFICLYVGITVTYAANNIWIQCYDWGNANFLATTSTPNRYDYIVMPLNQYDIVKKIKARNPKSKVLLYTNAAGMTVDCPDPNGGDWKYPSSGVSWCEGKKHKSWSLHWKNGQAITYPDYPSIHMANIGNKQYQKAWAARVIKQLKSNQWDGVFVDDTNLNFGHGINDDRRAPVKEYKSSGGKDIAYGNAMNSFIKYIGAQIKSKAKGKLIVPNLQMNYWQGVSGAVNLATCNKLKGAKGSQWPIVAGWLAKGYVTHIHIEHYSTWAGYESRGASSSSVAWRTGDVQAAWCIQHLTEAAGKGFIGVFYTSNAAQMQYARAMFLLGWKGNAASSLAYHGTDAKGDPYNSNWAFTVGAPAGPVTASGAGYWRKFKSGKVYLNPSGSTTTIGGVRVGPYSAVVKKGKSSPTPAPTPATSGSSGSGGSGSSSSSSATSGTTTSTYAMYADGVASGWTRQAARGTVSDVSSPVAFGSSAMRFSASSSWGNIEFLHGGFNVGSFTHLQFACKSSGSMQAAVFSGEWSSSVRQISISGYAGSAVNGYTVYTIPLSALGASGYINHVLIVDASESSSTTFYVDQLQFVASKKREAEEELLDDGGHKRDISASLVDAEEEEDDVAVQPSTIQSSQVMNLINKARVTAGIPYLKVSKSLVAIAHQHAKHMAKVGSATHIPKLGSRGIVRSVYYPYSTLFEAIMVGSVDDSADAVDHLLSGNQGKGIMKRNINQIGCAAVFSNANFYIVCEFGSLIGKKSRDTSSDDFSDFSSGSNAEDFDTSSYDDVSFGSDDVEEPIAVTTDASNNTLYSTVISNETLVIHSDECNVVTCDNAETALNPMSCSKTNACAPQACVKTTSCEARGQTCGFVFDGCNSTSCGECAADEVCSEKKCVKVTCPQGCPKNARCVTGTCLCPASSNLVGGECLPIKTLSLVPPELLSSYITTGNGEWTTIDIVDADYSQDDASGTITAVGDETMGDLDDVSIGIKQSVANANGKVIWKTSDKMAGGVLVFSAQSLLVGDSTSEISLLFRARDFNNYAYYKYVVGEQSFYTGAVVDGNDHSQLLGAYNWTAGERHELTAVIHTADHTVEFLVDGASVFANSVKFPSSLNSGGVGFAAAGEVAFGDIKYRSRVLLQLQMTCLELAEDVAGAIDKIAFALGVRSEQVTFSGDCGVTRARDITPMTFYVEGDMDYPAESVGSDMEVYAQTCSDVITSTEINVEAASIAADSASVPAIDLIVAASAVAAGLGVAAIAGIAVGAAAGVGAVTAGSVVVYKKSVSKKRADVPNEEEGKTKPKGAGANVFDFDPENHTSITARSQPAKKNIV